MGFSKVASLFSPAVISRSLGAVGRRLNGRAENRFLQRWIVSFSSALTTHAEWTKKQKAPRLQRMRNAARSPRARADEPSRPAKRRESLARARGAPEEPQHVAIVVQPAPTRGIPVIIEETGSAGSGSSRRTHNTPKMTPRVEDSYGLPPLRANPIYRSVQRLAPLSPEKRAAAREYARSAAAAGRKLPAADATVVVRGKHGVAGRPRGGVGGSDLLRPRPGAPRPGASKLTVVQPRRGPVVY